MAKQSKTIGEFEVLGVQFRVTQEPINGSDPLEYYSRLRLVGDEHEPLMPLCHTFDGCWNRKSFLKYVIERSGMGVEGAVGFGFFDPPEYDPRPELRFDLGDDENGVAVYFFEDDLEVSERFFVKVVLEAGTICVEQGMSRLKSAKDHLDQIKLAFADLLATLE